MATTTHSKDGERSQTAATSGRWLRNHKEIARFLKLKGSQKLLRTIGEWIQREDFPKKQRKGFVGEEVRAWYLRFAAEQARSDAPLIAARQIIENKRVPGKRALQSLEEGNSIAIEPPSGDGELPAGRRQHVGNPGPVPSQAAMAVELQLRYLLPIKRQTIQNWIHGIHLPKGRTENGEGRTETGEGRAAMGRCPRFPPPDPGRAGWNNPLPCYEWYEKWIVVPTKNAYAGDELQGNLFERKRADATMAEFEEQIDKSRKAKAEADALEREVSAKWILRDVARATGTRAMNDLLHFVEAEYERGAPGGRREKLTGLISELVNQRISELKAPGADVSALMNSFTHELANGFCSWDTADERARIDRIRAACAGAAGQNLTTDKTG